MGPTIFGHTLSDIHEGVSEIRKGHAKALPLKETLFTIDVINGLAVIKSTRTFINERDVSIEALMTFPVPFDAVLTGLSAEIDGRRLHSIAKAKDDARESYEEAVDHGKMAILHEEPLRGVHILSIGQLGSKKRVKIETEMVMALEDHSGTPFLRIPLTVGEIYGTSPLLPSDSLSTQPGLKMPGLLSVTERSGKCMFVAGGYVESGMAIPMNESVELLFPDQKFGHVSGFDAWGRKVSINLKHSRNSDKRLDVAIMLDRSGSTSERVGQNGTTIRLAIENAVRNVKRQLQDTDHVAIWEFDDEARLIAEGHVSGIRSKVLEFTSASGGTEIGSSIDTVIKHRPSAVIVLTDGQSYASEAHKAAALGYPISAVLVGAGSLDAMIGHLAASTGGQVYAAAEDDAETPLLNAIKGIRKGAMKLSGQTSSNKPISLKCLRSGTEVEILWGRNENFGQCDEVGRYAMALAMPLFDEPIAQELAILHGLVTHFTSLLIIDESGELSNNLPQSIKIPLPSLAASSYSKITASVDMSYMPNLALSSRSMMVDSMTDFMETSFSMSVSDKMDTFNNSLELFIMALQNFLKSNKITIDWDTFAGDFEESLSAWPSKLVEFLDSLKADSDFEELVDEVGLTIKEVAILFLANRDEKISRNASRVYRKIIGKIDPEHRIIIEENLHSI